MNLRSVCALCAASLLAGLGCSSPECTTKADCDSGLTCQDEKCVAPTTCSPACSGATPVCDASTLTCLTCTADEGCAAGLTCDTSVAGGRCLGCLEDADCSGATPACEVATGACVLCTADSHCSGATPVCETASHTCVAALCTEDADCSGATPACEVATGACVACTADSHCSGATPVCETTSHACVGCTEDADCPAATPTCDSTSHACVACADCSTVLKVVEASSSSTTTVVVEFDQLLDSATVLPDGSQFTFTGGLSASAASVAGKLVRVTTSAQTAGASYTVTVASTVQGANGAAVGSTGNSATFSAAAAQARLLINEINPNIPNSRDLIEFLVVEGGTTAQMTVVEEGKTGDTLTFTTFPAVVMQTGDLVVLHLNPVDAGDPSASERTSKSESTAANAYPDAWDFVGGSAAVSFSHRLIKVIAGDGTVQDAVAFAKVGLAGTPPGGYETAVQAAQADGEWLPADCGGAACTYDSTPSILDVSVDWSGVGNSSTSSLSRKPGQDTNTSADWVLKETGASFGSANP